MIVKKYVNVETEIEVQIDAEDIFESLAHLKDYEQKVIPAILAIKDFLDAIKDETITEMTNHQRAAIHDYLSKCAERFKYQSKIF